MRKRNIRKQYFLNEEENDELRRKSIKAGMTESNLIRSCLVFSCFIMYSNLY